LTITSTSYTNVRRYFFTCVLKCPSIFNCQRSRLPQQSVRLRTNC